MKVFFINHSRTVPVFGRRQLYTVVFASSYLGFSWRVWGDRHLHCWLMVMWRGHAVWHSSNWYMQHIAPWFWRIRRAFR